MNPEDILPPSDPKARIPNILPVMEPGERTLCTIKRHPIGILGIYAMCGLILTITAIVAFTVVPGAASGNTRQAVLAGTLIFVVVAAVCAAFALVAARVY